MKRDDGGLAFPSDGPDGQPGYSGGMTLRDYFAGQALATMKLANAWSDNPRYWEGVARSAYAAADAMLTAKGDR